MSQLKGEMYVPTFVNKKDGDGDLIGDVNWVLYNIRGEEERKGVLS